MSALIKPLPEGVLLSDKPKGWTSFDVVRRVKKWVRPAKVGHTGTLDPMATGLLPLTIGEATKLTRWLSSGDKRYLAEVSLGVATDTLDAEGKEVGRAPVPPFDAAGVERALAAFMGPIEQVPPMYSAIHHKGQRLYELARKGKEVERKPRQVHIHALTALEIGPDKLLLDVTCSAGTYIRTLAADLGERLGTLAHLSALKRTEACGFELGQAVAMADLAPEGLTQRMLPLEDVLQRYQRVEIGIESLRRLANGNRLDAEALAELGCPVPEQEHMVWFQAPEPAPLILAHLLPSGRDAAMEILRVLRPQAGLKKPAETKNH
jgi:tRNA pseudouridine55 synthase